MRLDELFDSTYPIDWKHKTADYWEGIFISNKEEYLINIHVDKQNYINATTKNPEQWVDFAFGLYNDGFSGSRLLGNNDNEFKIFSTAINAFIEYIEQEKPQNITIAASKKQHNRSRLYSKIIERFKNKLIAYGYKDSHCPHIKGLSNQNIDFNVFCMSLNTLREDKDEYQLPVIKKGDDVKIGKFKNKKAVVKGFDKDKDNQPVLKTNKGNVKLLRPKLTKLEDKKNIE